MRITLDYGDGTKKTYQLIRDIFLSKLKNPILEKLTDAANIGNYVFSCDSFTVNPITFPSSDIGKLSVFGTVNDISVAGGIAQYLSLAIVVEEGFLLKDLERVVDSIRSASKIAEVEIVTGDFKVVEKGKVDKIIITTSGIGKKIKEVKADTKYIRKKDKVIITGPIAQHGVAVMLARDKIFDFSVESDCCSLKEILVSLWQNFSSIKFMCDPTRGGIASVLNEISIKTGLGIVLKENKIPIKEEVRSACEILGVDPYYLASEGCAIIISEDREAKDIVRFLKKKGFSYAAVIGEVTSKIDRVIVDTIVGGRRILDFSYTLNIPRIC